jgi:hypothetical protein
VEGRGGFFHGIPWAHAHPPILPSPSLCFLRHCSASFWSQPSSPRGLYPRGSLFKWKTDLNNNLEFPYDLGFLVDGQRSHLSYLNRTLSGTIPAKLFSLCCSGVWLEDFPSPQSNLAGGEVNPWQFT